MGTGVVFAKMEEGIELPVIDVTNPAFTVDPTEGELAAMQEQFLRESANRGEMPAALQHALRNSLFGRALMAASGTYLGGMSTYRLKVGPDNLGAGATPIDRQIAASFPAFASRVRMQDMARLLAEGLAAAAARAPRKGICLVNIGGGPGADSWNALIHLRGERAGLLENRRIRITAMDVDPQGPEFGLRALEALCEPTAPLAGLDIEFQYRSYDWAESQRLRPVLEELRADGAVCAASSEGALFEYGSDEEIVANLRELHSGTAADAIVVGSVTREGEAVRASARASRVATRPRTLEAFRSLAQDAGWRLEEIAERAFSYNVRLVKA